MSQFIVNIRRQLRTRSPYEMHDLSAECPRLPPENNRVALGEFESSYSAKEEALKHFPEVEGCYYCCDSCNNAVQDFLRQSNDDRLNW
jgi:hypothetical protein